MHASIAMGLVKHSCLALALPCMPKQPNILPFFPSAWVVMGYAGDGLTLAAMPSLGHLMLITAALAGGMNQIQPITDAVDIRQACCSIWGCSLSDHLD